MLKQHYYKINKALKNKHKMIKELPTFKKFHTSQHIHAL